MRHFRRRKNEDPDIIEGEIEEISDDDSESVVAPPQEKPPRKGFFRRSKPDASPEFRSEAQVPLERVAPDIPIPDETALTPYVHRSAPEAPRRRGFRLPQVLAWGEMQPGMLLFALGLVAGGVFWMLYNLGKTPTTLNQWWPMVLLAFAALWAVYSLIIRHASAFLAATVLIGISFSLWLDAQDYLIWRETLIGCILIALGLGIMVRGLLLRQGTTA